MSQQLVILGTSVTLPDPASVNDLAASFQQQGGQLAELETALQSLTRPDAWGEWTGLAADAFGQSIGQLPAEIGDVRDAYDDVVSALQQYAGQLEPVVNSLSTLSYQAEDAEGTLAAVSTARSQVIASGQDPAATGWDARLADAAADVTAAQGQLNRLLAELNSLAATCTKQIKAAEPKTTGKSLFVSLETDFVRDVADPLGRGAKVAGKDALNLLDGMFVQPFTQLWPDLVAYVNDPDLHNAGVLLGDIGDAAGAIALVAGIVVFTVGTLGLGDVAAGGVAGAVAVAAADIDEASDGLDAVAEVAHESALILDIGAVASGENDASWSDLSQSALSVVSDNAGDYIDANSSSGASLLFSVSSGAETTAFDAGLTHELSVPQVVPDAPDVVSGLQVTANAVQGLQGLPAAPALQAAGGASIVQPAVSVPSPAVVNIQHVALSPQPGGASGSNVSGPEGNM